MLISLENIDKYYHVAKDDIHVLKSLNLQIESGEFILIMGKSGSGKTTLLNILSFLDAFDSGKYYFDGQDVSKFNENQRSEFRNKNIGFVFQQFNLIETLDIYQNVQLPLLYGSSLKKEERDLVVRKRLEEVDLLEKIHSKPIQLSGGQQQRVAIARALVNDPQIIFADEPTGALDSETSADIMSLLKRLNEQGKTIVMVTHDKDMSVYATRIIELKDGSFVSEVRL